MVTLMLIKFVMTRRRSLCWIRCYSVTVTVVFIVAYSVIRRPDLAIRQIMMNSVVGRLELNSLC